MLFVSLYSPVINGYHSGVKLKHFETALSLNWDSALIKRHDIAGPRYTSYPTALQFNQSLNADSLINSAQHTLDNTQPLSLYFHIPFCAHVCYYCACNKVITRQRERAQPYLETLYTEMAYMAEHFSGDRVVTQLHWGGGTPTFLSDGQISQLMDNTRKHFNLLDNDNGDYSIEIDPRECSQNTLNRLRETGFNRISLGVQDVQLKVQQAVNRVQPIHEIAQLMAQARDLGFKSINIDLIYGLPFQSVASFSDTLSQIIKMSPDRLSIFNYAHMPDRFRAQRHINATDLPSPAEKLKIQQQTIALLTAAGYQYIGMDHFAKPDDALSIAQHTGKLHRNFQGYTTHSDCDLIAMGVSAISQIGDTYYQNNPNLSQYTDLVNANNNAIYRGVSLTQDDIIRRDLITQLICHFSLDISAFSAKHQLDFQQYFADELIEIKQLAEDKLVSYDSKRLNITASGRILVRRVCMVFDAYRPKLNQQQQFSRII